MNKIKSFKVANNDFAKGVKLRNLDVVKSDVYIVAEYCDTNDVIIYVIDDVNKVYFMGRIDNSDSETMKYSFATKGITFDKLLNNGFESHTKNEVMDKNVKQEVKRLKAKS